MSRSKIRRPLATIYAGEETVWLVANFRGARIIASFCASSPTDMFQQALDRLRQETGIRRLDRFQWRLVLPDGFHHLSEMRAARWSAALCEAVGAELERECPFSLDDLTVASLPLSANSVWTVAIPTETLQCWHQAATTLGLVLEGIWTCASALVEYRMEQSITESRRWTDGRLLIDVARDEVGVSYSTADPDSAIRKTEGFSTEALPTVAEPAQWAHELRRIDPSESFNLARGSFAPDDLVRKRHRSLAAALWCVSLALVLATGAAMIYGNAQTRRQQTESKTLAQLWQNIECQAPLPAMPVDSLAHQVTAWRSLHQRGALGHMNRSALDMLGQFCRALPRDIPVNINHIEIRGGELLIDGQVNSQAEARRLAEALGSAFPHGSDPVRTAASDGGLVGFSLRLRTGTEPTATLAYKAEQ